MGTEPLSGERRGQTRVLIDKLLEERREMLILYEQVGGVEPYASSESLPDLVIRFGQVLVDYIAAGHFGLYERIAAGKERRDGVRRLAESLYPRIAATTDAAIAFNDALEAEEDAGALSDSMLEELSALGEHLATRVELEDALIAAMLGAGPRD